MSDELEIIKRQLPEMAGILNAIPGERFELKCAQTLLIVQRRMEESELQTQLAIYNHLFSKEGTASITDLSNVAVAYVKIKTLCEAGNSNFDQISIRELIKEFHAQETKVLNIIHLSKVNALAAEDYQKEIIKRTLNKSEKYLKAFADEIKRAEKKIEKDPVSLIQPKEQVSGTCVEETPKKSKSHIFSMIFDKVVGWVEGFRYRKDVNSFLKKEEARQADSRCEEIPFYEKILKYTERHICKDIPEFSIFLKRGNVYFGKTGNVNAGVYMNQDQSLLELMNVSQDFIQFMTTDLLNGQYELKAFTDSEKKAMQLYFNYVCVCFEKHIGRELSVQEYLHFKDYYNRLILMMFALEEKKQDDYYRALSIADNYITYMQGYDLTVSDGKEEIIKNIIAEKNLNYVGDLKLILEIHVVCEDARESLQSLIEKIRYFHGTNKSEDPEKTEEPVDLKGAKIVVEILDEMGQISDEAIFSASNIEIAVMDYLKKNAIGKRIGIEKNGVKTYFFAGKRGGMSIPILANETRAAWNEDERIYFEKIEQKISETIIKIGGYSI